MNHSSQQDLLGYMLGALDAQEQRDLQQQIDNNPALEESLLDLKVALTPLDSIDNKGYRPGLARRTCEAIANWDAESAASRLAFLDQTDIDWDESCEPHPHQTPAPIPAVDPTSDSCPFSSIPVTEVLATKATDNQNPHPKNLAPELSRSNSFTNSGGFKASSWSMRDMLVGVAALAVLAGLLFPALNYSRQRGRMIACQSNLLQVGQGLMGYSEMHDGQFPAISEQGNLAVNGSYAPILKAAGLVTDDSMFACPGVIDATPVSIPSIDQVEAAKTETQRLHYHKTMGGHFGYSMGYKDGDRYQAPRAGIANVVLLADRPSNRSDRQSLSHDGDGQNCLFGDGRVMFVSGPAYGEDLVYENDRGIVGPGAHALDSVIGPSHLSPTF